MIAYLELWKDLTISNDIWELRLNIQFCNFLTNCDSKFLFRLFLEHNDVDISEIQISYQAGRAIRVPSVSHCSYKSSWSTINPDSMYVHSPTSLVAQTVKPLPAMWETWVQSLGLEDSLEKEMATHSSTLAWKIPWTEEPGRLQSMGWQRVGHNWVTSLHLPKPHHPQCSSMSIF